MVESFNDTFGETTPRQFPIEVFLFIDHDGRGVLFLEHVLLEIGRELGQLGVDRLEPRLLFVVQLRPGADELVYVGGPSLNITTLADLLVRAGAVTLTAAGRKQLVKETTKWKRLATAIGRILDPAKEG